VSNTRPTDDEREGSLVELRILHISNPQCVGVVSVVLSVVSVVLCGRGVSGFVWAFQRFCVGVVFDSRQGPNAREKDLANLAASADIRHTSAHL
jgi:hypothetical protein